MRLSRFPPLKNLRAFCVAARHLSFKIAADELCLTPSAVSHQMRELETMLCTRLFERRTRSLALTPAGHRLLETVEPLLDGLDRALTQLARQDGRETLRVRAPALFANELSSARRIRSSTFSSTRAIRVLSLIHRRPTYPSCSPIHHRRVSAARACSRVPSLRCALRSMPVAWHGLDVRCSVLCR